MRKLALFNDLPGKATLTSLSVPVKATEADVTKALRVIGHLERGSPWWAADLLNFSEDRWGEKVGQIAEALGWAPATVVNVMRIGRAVPPSRRLETLPFSVHAEVASLDPDEQRHWLAKAEKGDGGDPWSSRRLRAEMKGLPAASEPASEACPTCGKAGYKKP